MDAHPAADAGQMLRDVDLAVVDDKRLGDQRRRGQAWSGGALDVDQDGAGGAVLGPDRVSRPVPPRRPRPERLEEHRADIHCLCRDRRQPDPRDAAGVPVHPDTQFGLNPLERQRVEREDVQTVGVHQQVLARPCRPQLAVWTLRPTSDIPIALRTQPEQRMPSLHLLQQPRRRRPTWLWHNPLAPARSPEPRSARSPSSATAATGRLQKERLGHDAVYGRIEVGEEQARQFQSRLVDHVVAHRRRPVGTPSSATDLCTSGTSAMDEPTAEARQAPYLNLGPPPEDHAPDGHSLSEQRCPPPTPSPRAMTRAAKGVSGTSTRGTSRNHLTRKGGRPDRRVSQRRHRGQRCAIGDEIVPRNLRPTRGWIRSAPCRRSASSAPGRRP